MDDALVDAFTDAQDYIEQSCDLVRETFPSYSEHELLAMHEIRFLKLVRRTVERKKAEAKALANRRARGEG